MKTAALLARYRIDDPKRFRLASFDPADSGGLDLDKPASEAILKADIKRLAALQENLYAQGQWALLIVLQGLDAAGKDGVVEHVMSGVNPQGCEVHSFKQPSAEELAHDFLWRASARLPQRGHIGIFNRSHYEEVLVVRVHPELLARQRLPDGLAGKDIWKQRFKDIRAFERHLARSGVVVLKFFLHISKEEQRKRFLDRLEEPAKRWKFSLGDIAERKLWDQYQAAYEDMVRSTSRPQAPWYVVPANHKWFTRLIVAAAIVEALEKIDPQPPVVAGAALEELNATRAALTADAPSRSDVRKPGHRRRAKRGRRR
jgi:PPK2 family polyphosphate:nucleotide phosphotransferase